MDFKEKISLLLQSEKFEDQRQYQAYQRQLNTNLESLSQRLSPEDNYCLRKAVTALFKMEELTGKMQFQAGVREGTKLMLHSLVEPTENEI